MTLQAFIHLKEKRADGSFDCLQTISVPVRESVEPRSGATQTGYGKRLPTPYEVKFNGRWRRVKCICFSNAGTLYIGRDYTNTCNVSIDRV